MPRAPDATQHVQPAPLPNVRVQAAPTADTFGAQIGDTTAQIGLHLFDREVKAANEAAILKADNALANLQTQAEVMITSAKGQQALGIDKLAREAYDKGAAAVQAELSNDTQRGAFEARRDHRWSQTNRFAQFHIQREHASFQDQNTKAGLDSVMDRVRLRAEDPTVVADEMKKAMVIYNDFAVRHGQSGQVTEAMRADPHYVQTYLAQNQALTAADMADPTKHTQFVSPAHTHAQVQLQSSMHRQVINGLLAKELDQQAETYLTANKGKFTEADLNAVEKVVLEGSSRGESRRELDRIMDETGGVETSAQRKQALDLAHGLPNAKVADLTEQRIAHRITEYDQLKGQAYTDRFMAASKIIDQTWHQNPKRLIQDLVGAETWLDMKPHDQDALRVKLERLRMNVTPHEPQIWANFQNLLDADLAKLTENQLLGTYLNHFDPSHYDRALQEWNAARNLASKGVKEPQFISALTNRERIKNKWEDSRLSANPKKLTTEEEIWYKRFETEADKALSNLPEDAKPEEIDKVLTGLSDRLLKEKVKVPGSFWGFFNRTVPKIDLLDQYTKMEDIPTARLEQLKKALEDKKVPVTRANIEELDFMERKRHRK